MAGGAAKVPSGRGVGGRVNPPPFKQVQTLRPMVDGFHARKSLKWAASPPILGGSGHEIKGVADHFGGFRAWIPERWEAKNYTPRRVPPPDRIVGISKGSEIFVSDIMLTGTRPKDATFTLQSLLHGQAHARICKMACTRIWYIGQHSPVIQRKTIGHLDLLRLELRSSSCL